MTILQLYHHFYKYYHHYYHDTKVHDDSVIQRAGRVTPVVAFGRYWRFQLYNLQKDAQGESGFTEKSCTIGPM